jgi:hypothetical protein
VNKDWLDSAIAAAFCFVGACMVIVLMALFGFLSGCTVQHTAPQLDTLGATMKQIVIEDCKQPVLAMPPVPMDCTLDIRPTSAVASSKACEDMLRFYVQARSLLAAPVASRPR